MFMISNIRRVFEIMITVTQIDIALYAVVIEQLTAIITIRLLMFELCIVHSYRVSVSIDIYFRVRLFAVIETKLGFTIY